MQVNARVGEALLAEGQSGAKKISRTSPDGVEDQHAPSGGIGPPPSQGGVKDEAHQHRGGQDAVDQRDPALGPQDRIAQRLAGPGFTGAASANITAAVIAVQMIPGTE